MSHENEKRISASPDGLRRWQKGGVREIARTRIFRVEGVKFQHPDQAEAREFVTVAAPDWVNVVAVTPRDELVLVRQFRFGVDDFSLEIPGGVIDAGEDPLVAAARELREETGFVGGRIRLLGRVHPNPAFLRNRAHLVLIEGAERVGETAWDENEEIEVVVAPVAEVFAQVRRGEITHALVLDALLLFRLEREGQG